MDGLSSWFMVYHHGHAVSSVIMVCVGGGVIVSGSRVGVVQLQTILDLSLLCLLSFSPQFQKEVKRESPTVASHHVLLLVRHLFCGPQLDTDIPDSTCWPPDHFCVHVVGITFKVQFK